jgi:hypothetical protein
MIQLKLGNKLKQVDTFPFEIELDLKYRGEIERTMSENAKNEYDVCNLEYLDDMGDWQKVEDKNYTAENTIIRYCERFGIADDKNIES